MNPLSLTHWDLAAIIMGVASALVYVTQRLGARAFRPIFEVCIFYLPLSILIAIDVGVRLRARRSSSADRAREEQRARVD